MWQLFRFLRPYRWSIAAVVALTLVHSLADLYLPRVMAHIVDIGVAGGDSAFILRRGGPMLLAATLSMVCSVVALFLSSRVSMAFGRDLRSGVFAQIESFSLHEFDSFGCATLITRTSNDVMQMQNFVMMSLRMMVLAPLMCLGGIVMAVSTDRRLALVLAGAVPVLVAAIIAIALRGAGAFRLQQSRLDRLSLVLRERLLGMRVIRAFNRTEADGRRFEAANRELTSAASSAQTLMALFMPVMMLVMNLAGIVLVGFGARRIGAGHMQVGSLMAFLQYAMQILFAFMMLSIMFATAPRAAVSATRLNQVLAKEIGIREPATVRQAASDRGTVELVDVVFRYPGAEEPALDGVSFRAAAGEVTAIIGGTGAGKSTVANLLLRFHDVTAGSVRVDGVDVRELALEDLRQRIGFVPQNAVLFSDSIAENLRCGCPGASDQQLRHAASVAQAVEFIDAMPEGFATRLARGGANLSGGQRQRLCMARALVRRPRIYVFDDSFSALDPRTDAALRRALRNETGEAAVIIVAQRVSTIVDADRIVVLDEGRVAGIGTHRELLAGCPVYREIVGSQQALDEVGT